jgi:flagellar protein FlgJ
MRIDPAFNVRSGGALSPPGGHGEPPLRTDGTGLSDKQDKRLKDACKDFEALFLSTILKQMRKTVEKSELFGSDPAEDTFQEMMDVEVGKSAAKTSSMGIADMLYRQLTSDMARQADSSQARNDAGPARNDGGVAQAAVPPSSDRGDEK